MRTTLMGNVVLGKAEYEEIQRVLSKRAEAIRQRDGQIESLKKELEKRPLPDGTPKKQFYCPTCDQRIAHANRLSAGYIGTCGHVAFNLNEFDPIRTIKAHHELNTKYEQAILELREANDRVEDLLRTEVELRRARQEIATLKQVIRSVGQEVPGEETRAKRSINV